MSQSPRLVAVIAGKSDLEAAQKLRTVPDLFELRLDHFTRAQIESSEAFCRLPAPLVITARHPAEGGAAGMNPNARASLLREFLPYAQYVDVELRSAKAMQRLLTAAQTQGVKRILSVHRLEQPASTANLERWFAAALEFAPDIFKIAMRTDSGEELDRLLHFFGANRKRLPIAAMGIGRLGRKSRLELARLGSALNYAHLGTSEVEGQLSLAQLRRALKSSRRASQAYSPRS